MWLQDIMSLPGKPTFILFILRQQAEETRQQIKYTCDVKLGILNQCVVRIIFAPSLARKSEYVYCNVVARGQTCKSVKSVFKQCCAQVSIFGPTDWCNDWITVYRINARLGGENSIPRSQALTELQKTRFMVVGGYISVTAVAYLLTNVLRTFEPYQARMSDTLAPGSVTNLPSRPSSGVGTNMQSSTRHWCTYSHHGLRSSMIFVVWWRYVILVHFACYALFWFLCFR
jgi:hypothetical protein